MLPKRQEGQIESNIPDGWIRLEYGSDGTQRKTEKRDVITEAESQRYDVDKGVELKDVSEEQMKVVKHFREEVPK